MPIRTRRISRCRRSEQDPRTAGRQQERGRL